MIHFYLRLLLASARFDSCSPHAPRRPGGREGQQPQPPVSLAVPRVQPLRASPLATGETTTAPGRRQIRREPLFNSSQLRIPLALLDRFKPHPSVSPLCTQDLLGDKLRRPHRPSWERSHHLVSPPRDPSVNVV